MNKCCPKCHTEMVERSSILFCPRHDIGDCTYDAQSFEHQEYGFIPDQIPMSEQPRQSSCEV